MGEHGGPRGGAASRACLFQGAPTCPIKCRPPPQPTPMPGSLPPPPPPTAQEDCTPTPNRDPQLSRHVPPLPGLPLRHSDPSHPAWTPSEGSLPPPPGPLGLPHLFFNALTGAAVTAWRWSPAPLWPCSYMCLATAQIPAPGWAMPATLQTAFPAPDGSSAKPSRASYRL